MEHLSLAFITVFKMYTVLFLWAPPAQYMVGTAAEASHWRWWRSWPIACFRHHFTFWHPLGFLVGWGCCRSLIRSVCLRDKAADGRWGRGRIYRYSWAWGCRSSRRKSDPLLLAWSCLHGGCCCSRFHCPCVLGITCSCCLWYLLSEDGAVAGSRL